MADPRRFSPGQRAGAITQRDYTLQPVRSRRMRVARWLVVCAVCVAAGAAAMRSYVGQRVPSNGPCLTSTYHDEAHDEPHDEPHDDPRDALMRARLALTQQSASRASVQKSADALAAEVGRLKAQVLFLQGQSHPHR
jgi:hypothetical protein